MSGMRWVRMFWVLQLVFWVAWLVTGWSALQWMVLIYGIIIVGLYKCWELQVWKSILHDPDERGGEISLCVKFLGMSAAMLGTVAWASPADSLMLYASLFFAGAAALFASTAAIALKNARAEARKFRAYQLDRARAHAGDSSGTSSSRAGGDVKSN